MTELERSNQELERFASVASHDLQEPLRKIRAFGERLETACEGRLPEKGRDYLARMTAAAARMQTLIDSVLSLARVSTRGETWRAIDLGTVVSEVVADLEEALSRTGGHVEVEAGSGSVHGPILARRARAPTRSVRRPRPVRPSCDRRSCATRRSSCGCSSRR